MTEVNRFVGKNMIKTYNTNFSKIVSLILKMSDEQQSTLLERAQSLFDKRKKERLPCLIPATLYTNCNSYHSFLLDVNDSGAFIETNEQYPIGQTIRVAYFDPFHRRPYKFIAEIIWSSSFAIGVKFLENFGKLH